MKRSTKRGACSIRSMPFVERGVPVVGLEPSCLLSLRDEFLQYGYGEEARKLSRVGVSVRGVSRAREGGRAIAVSRCARSRASRAWVHGHCHQKAFDAFRPVQTVLGWIPELEV